MDWKDIYMPMLETEQMAKLKERIKQERNIKAILPAGTEVFNAFKFCPYEKLKLVIIGQDPYPSPDHPHGLAFSSKALSRPKSLQNIFMEIHSELYRTEDFNTIFPSSDLTRWAEQGILLLNRVLTVEANAPDSHKGWGWEKLTDQIIQHIAEKHPNNIVFMFWGNNAKECVPLVAPHDRHLILMSAHPSPLSADKGFFGNGHFKEAQDFIQKEFFKSFKKIAEENDNALTMAQLTKTWYEDRGAKIDLLDLKNTYRFVTSRFAESCTFASPELRNLYELNFRTNGKQNETSTEASGTTTGRQDAGSAQADDSSL